MHYWVQASSSYFGGTSPLKPIFKKKKKEKERRPIATPPQPRSGHTAVNIGKSKVVVFGGLVDKKFLSDIVVYDVDNKLWFQPECTGSGSEDQVGPSPRAFYIAVAIDCHMFIFGGRYGSKRLGDFWVLDTDVWQWSELTSVGDLPLSRDFAAASAIGNRKIVMEASVGDMVEENETPGWTQLKLPGQAPSSHCSHTVTSGGHYLLLFGGHGTGGWLSRYDIYYSDCIVLDWGECLKTLLVGFLADMRWMCHHDVNERSILFML
ncbi:hypothetical protein CMV_007790 [Castanea mollissima]|uniref:Uncharacterized protein n=1 Tax=Castanea mollissima TaxID=60419 RepID=A0A8J4W012_9ROSI|nr:hypothetical protein CMV_007790 [Castanea mollissima]